MKLLTRPRQAIVKAADHPNLPRLKFIPNRKGLTADEQEVAQAIQDAIAKLQVSAGGNDVLIALFGNDYKQAIAELDWTGWDQALERAKVLLAEHYTAAEQATILAISPDLAVLTAHAMPYAAQAATHVGEQITGITDRTLEAVQSVIGEAVDSGWSIPRIADLLKDVVGLNEVQAGALGRYETGLLDAGRTESEIGHLISAYRDKLGEDRAKTIARYETQTAMNQGRLAGWNQAVLHGAIGPDATKQWVTGDDPCPICQDLDGEEVGLNEAFSSGDDVPPAHPNCRCTSIIANPGTPDLGETEGGDA